VRGAEFAQQHIQALGFRNEDRRAQAGTQVEGLAGKVAQQIFCHQDAEHIFLVLAHGGKARVRGIEHELQRLFERCVDVDDVHLRARYHDVAYLHFRDRQRAFDHRKRIGIHQVAVIGTTQELEQLLSIFGRAEQQ